VYPAGPATCDGSFFRDQDIVVVSGVHGRDKPRASKIIIEGALNNDKIHFTWNSGVKAIHGQDKATLVTLRDTAVSSCERRPRPSLRAGRCWLWDPTTITVSRRSVLRQN
jgi:thioredoxin reductase